MLPPADGRNGTNWNVRCYPRENESSIDINLLSSTSHVTQNEIYGAACTPVHAGVHAIVELFFRQGSRSCWASPSVMKEQAAPGSRKTLSWLEIPFGPVIWAIQVISNTCLLSFIGGNMSHIAGSLSVSFLDGLTSSTCSNVWWCFRQFLHVCLRSTQTLDLKFEVWV